MTDTQTAPPTPTRSGIGPDELAELRAAGSEIRILDVRTPGEFETVHIRGSYNIPLDKLGEHASEIDDEIILVCQSGNRATRAEEILEKNGVEGLRVLRGGMASWIGAGQPVERGANRISLERQVRIAAGTLVAIGAVLALVVNPLWALLPLFVGSGLVFAGVTDTCGMAMVLAKLPYNRATTCSVDSALDALKSR